MAAQEESSASIFDTAKLVLVIVLLVLGIVGFYYFASYALVYRVIGILIVFGLAAAIVFTTAIGRQAWGFITESKMEVRKVIWPTRQETMQATMLVVAVVFGVALMLGFIDWFLGKGVAWLTGQKV